MLGTSTRSGFRRGCGRASWRPPSDLVDRVHVSGALSGAHRKGAPRWQTHAQRRNLGISVRPGHPTPAATCPAHARYFRAIWFPSRLRPSKLRLPSDLVDQVHVSGALSGACTGKGRQMANPRPTPKPEDLRPPWPPGTSGNPAGYSRGRPLRGLKMIVGSLGIPWG